MAEEDEQDDVAGAFKDLTAEVRVMRRAVEALEAKKPTDYAPTLAAFSQRLEKLTLATLTLAERPAMTQTPESYAAQLRRAADDAARAVSAELYRAQSVTGNLERALGGVRTREEQRTWLLRAAIGGIAAGVLLWAVVPGLVAREIVPASWHWPERMAARTLRLAMSDAGRQLVVTSSPETWNALATGGIIVRANREAIDQCRKAAARAREVVRCTIRIDFEGRT